MASKNLSRALRAASRQKLTAPAIPKRSFVTSLPTRPAVAAAARVAAAPLQQTRGVKTVDFAGHKEKVFGKMAFNFRGRMELTTKQSEKTGPGRNC